MDFKQIIQKTIDLSKGFSSQYDERDHFVDMVEEVGELAQALQIANGRKYTSDPAKNRTAEDVNDGMCDILFELIRLADKRGIDFEAEYLKTLEQIKKRMESGEFDKKYE